MKMKMAFIGFGKSTNRYHLPYVLNRDHIEVKKIFSRTRKKELEDIYKEDKIEFTNQISDVVKDEEIDLVSICTTHSTHYEFAKLCLENGKHVLVEKPFAVSLTEAKELIELAKKKNLIIMPFQNRRFDSDFLALKDVMSSHAVGEIVELESHFDYYRPDNVPSGGNFYDGAFFGLGVHTIDQAICLFGKPEKVYADIRSVRNPDGPDDYYHTELFYPSHKVILKTSHLVKTPYPKFILHGTKGSFIKYGIDRQEECLKSGMTPEQDGFGVDTPESYGIVTAEDENGVQYEKVIETPIGDYGKVYDHMYETIMSKKPKLVSDEEILTVVEILEKGLEGPNPKLFSL